MASTDGEQGLTKTQGNIIIGLLVVAVGVVAFVGLSVLPKAERAVQVTERLETRFQSFADEVQPVVRAGAGKTIEAIKDMDAGAIAEEGTNTATRSLKSLGNAIQQKLGDR